MKKFLFWFLAVVITLGSAVYQQKTGPTHDLRGKVVVEGTEIKYKLPRTAETVRDAEVAIAAPAPLLGYLEYKRFKTDDDWTRVPLAREGDRLVGLLPKQPAAGKLAYKVSLTAGYVATAITGEDPVVIRFKDPVPAWVIFPHVLVIFAAMLFSTAAGLAALDKKRNPRRFVLWAVGLLFVGGFVLGPLMQKFAFGVAWTGFPLGMDLTDNKTLIAFLFWIAALIAGRKGKPARPFVLAASLVTLLIFLVPHSLLGSELDYSKMQ
ncbi:MAG: hypothetical protein A2Y70_06530 [Candidatus Aminicenantes bacterium RBG_13_64_14]|nr:MAG: hypothetical protein A2Y70_06530 [Candidatus Aminicenantes bacterium RBG_13_64_14]